MGIKSGTHTGLRYHHATLFDSKVPIVDTVYIESKFGLMRY